MNFSVLKKQKIDILRMCVKSMRRKDTNHFFYKNCKNKCNISCRTISARITVNSALLKPLHISIDFFLLNVT